MLIRQVSLAEALMSHPTHLIHHEAGEAGTLVAIITIDALTITLNDFDKNFLLSKAPVLFF
jgi:hypothetical protein